jgi:hypothetical protein
MPGSLVLHLCSGTGFSREEVIEITGIFAAWRLTPSRLKPVPHYCLNPG